MQAKTTARDYNKAAILRGGAFKRATAFILLNRSTKLLKNNWKNYFISLI